MVPDALPDDRFQFRDPSILRRDDRAERRFGLAVVAGGFQPVPVFADFAAQGSSVWTRSGHGLGYGSGEGDEEVAELWWGALTLAARHIGDDPAAPGALVSTLGQPLGG